MAQKRTRKAARTRSGATRKPELRTSRYNEDGTLRKQPKPVAKSAKPTRRQRRSGMRTLLVRPEGALGLAASIGCAIVLVGIGLIATWILHRWDTFGYADSLWWWLSIGGLASTAPFAYVARSRGEARAWPIGVGIVSLAAIVVERAIVPGCHTGVNCSAYGALGQFGVVWSVVLSLAFAAAGWLFASWLFARTEQRRPGSGWVSTGAAINGQFWIWTITGLPIIAAMIGVDYGVRPAQGWAAQAKSDVYSTCFTPPLAKPALSVRPDPEANGASFWVSYLVRRSDETRPKAGSKHGKVTGWLSLATGYPYEAQVSYDSSSGDLVNIQCRRVAPDAGNAVSADINPPDFSGEDPVKPADILTAPGQTPGDILSTSGSASGLGSAVTAQ